MSEHQNRASHVPDGTQGSAEADLGFTYTATKSGVVFIRRHGRQVTELRGKPAQTFLAKVQRANLAEQQQLMARVTGNYKRGNERLAGGNL